MDEKNQVANTTSASAEAKKAPKPWWAETKHSVRHAIAILFWSYVTLKLFVLDVDEVLVRRLLPSAIWLVEYRGVVLLVVLAALALLAWGFRLLGAMLYILFYPFVVAIWHVPSFLFRHRAWTLTLALLAVSASALRSLRWTIIILGALVAGATLVAAGVSGIAVAVGLVLLCVALVFVYGRTILGAFRSSLDVFSARSLDSMWTSVSKGFAPAEELRTLEPEAMTEAQRNVWVTHLQSSVLYARVCYFLVGKLRKLRRGRIVAATGSIRVVSVFVLTVVVFALASLGLYKIDHSQYGVSGVVRGFDFLWYAFQASFMNGVSEIVPKGMAARALFMLNELTTGLILLVVVVFLVTGVQVSRNADQMDSLIRKIREHGEVSERFVQEQFGLTVAAAIDELRRVNAGMISWIIELSSETDLDEQGRDRATQRSSRR